MFNEAFGWFINNLSNLIIATIAVVAATVSIRTYISINEPQIEFSLDENLYGGASGITGELLIKLKNNGKTPAYNLEIQCLTKPTKTDISTFSYRGSLGKIDSLMEETIESPRKIMYLPQNSERWYHGFNGNLLPNDKHDLSKFKFLITWETQKFLFKKKIKSQEYVIDYEDFANSLLRYEHMPLVKTIGSIELAIKNTEKELKANLKSLDKLNKES